MDSLDPRTGLGSSRSPVTSLLVRICVPRTPSRTKLHSSDLHFYQLLGCDDATGVTSSGEFHNSTNDCGLFVDGITPVCCWWNSYGADCNCWEDGLLWPRLCDSPRCRVRRQMECPQGHQKTVIGAYIILDLVCTRRRGCGWGLIHSSAGDAIE